MKATVPPDRPQLDLCFSRSPSGETYLKRQYARFPFHLTRSLGTDDEALVILQALGAGLLQGDSFLASILLEEGAAARVVTQGSTIAHAMPDGAAEQRTVLEIRPGASLTHLPKPLILFPAASVTTSLEIVLHPGASVMWCDAFLSHDVSRDDSRFRFLRSETVLRSPTGGPLMVDRFEIDGRAIDDPGVMSGFAVHAGVGWAGVEWNDELMAEKRADLAACRDVMGGLSRMPNGTGVFARLLAADGVALQQALDALIAG